MKKIVLSTACVALLALSLMGCATPNAASPGGEIAGNSPLEGAIVEVQDGDNVRSMEDYQKEAFQPYEQFGLTYDSEKDELFYNGKLVRWFEDYYPLEDDAHAGRDFFNENGVVDVYAVRDLNSFVTRDDGSIDPSGKLTGLKEFSQADFDKRDIEAIKNPPAQVAVAGGVPSAAEMEKIASEYEPFGLTYDASNDQWIFNGEKVRYFRDILTSNGESLTGGKFSGTMRTFGNGTGTVDIYTIRDFTKQDANGNGVLTSIEKYTQQEFDEHTQAGKSDNVGVGAVAGTTQG